MFVDVIMEFVSRENVSSEKFYKKNDKLIDA